MAFDSAFHLRIHDPDVSADLRPGLLKEVVESIEATFQGSLLCSRVQRQMCAPEGKAEAAFTAWPGETPTPPRMVAKEVVDGYPFAVTEVASITIPATGEGPLIGSSVDLVHCALCFIGLLALGPTQWRLVRFCPDRPENGLSCEGPDLPPVLDIDAAIEGPLVSDDGIGLLLDAVRGLERTSGRPYLIGRRLASKIMELRAREFGLRAMRLERHNRLGWSCSERTMSRLLIWALRPEWRAHSDGLPASADSQDRRGDDRLDIILIGRDEHTLDEAVVICEDLIDIALAEYDETRVAERLGSGIIICHGLPDELPGGLVDAPPPIASVDSQDREGDDRLDTILTGRDEHTLDEAVAICENLFDIAFAEHEAKVSERLGAVSAMVSRLRDTVLPSRPDPAKQIARGCTVEVEIRGLLCASLGR